VRNRDTMAQERVAIDELPAYVINNMRSESTKA
jgi:glycyl-tRNA synthetase (class II)